MTEHRRIPRVWSQKRYFRSRCNLIQILTYLILTILVLCGLYTATLHQSAANLEYPSYPASFDDTTPPKDVDWNARAEKVKEAFRHAYGGYEKYAAPADELRPISKAAHNPFNGWGVSAFDSLDTMLLMGLDEEFERALNIVATTNFTLPKDQKAPYFETVIRYMGGLLSAYALSGENILLERADELAELLDPVFNTTSGLPAYSVNPSTGSIHHTVDVALAEIASLQLEYSYLAHLTRKRKWNHRVSNVINKLQQANVDETGGMLPTRWNIVSGVPIDNTLTTGGQADSAHEYLLKQHLLTSKTDETSLDLYIRATTHIITRLLYISPQRQLLYVTDTRRSSVDPNDWPTHKFEHLSCFLPGLLALGATSLPLDSYSDRLKNMTIGHDYGNARDGYKKLAAAPSLKEMHMLAAEGLAMSCWLSYADQATGLGPEIMLMRTPKDDPPHLWIDLMGKWFRGGRRGIPPGHSARQPVMEEHLRGYDIMNAKYLLRPETIESLYILWKVTGDVRWKQKGWLIFEAIEKQAKTDQGYAVISSVVTSPAEKQDEMPSFFLAETLKYLYLLFDERDLLPLDKWVLNTEAHPFPVFAPL